ncbi:DUF2913 family protein [Shewanella sp. SW32]|uniref:DUF2913 family protein n=1 Tax=unclassified Shewanella TaxID=196818 RepID=UPI0021DA6E28|nr:MULTISPECIES: DUF2913 family protein [unclassified Shewanella]MCU7965379.1 DUF2913 family protein [Shewanella sp. SW32]MCU7973364.1 DUF2913 family protein [Shewanella sp. SW29]
MTEYYQSLKCVCENALIHLYLDIALVERYVPKATRTSILRKYLKERVKSPNLKSCKKELKKLSLVPDSVHLEHEICMLLDNLEVYRGKGEAESYLFDFLGDLHVSTQLMVQLSTPSTVAHPGNIYLCNDEIFNKLDSHGKYLEPVTLFVYVQVSSEIEQLMAWIDLDGRFNAQVLSQHENHAKIAINPK